MKDKDLCSKCRFNNDCASDWANRFRKRRGASMVNVIVFMAASLMITAHVFFFSTMSGETKALQVKALQNRFRFDRALDTAIDAIKEHDFASDDNGDPAPIAAFAAYQSLDGVFPKKIHVRDVPEPYTDYKGFHDSTITIKKEYNLSDGIHVCIYDLHYKYIHDYQKATDGKNWKKVARSERVFPSMYKDDYNNVRYYLIRINRIPSDTAQKKSMHQVLVKCIGTSKPYKVEPLSFQEVWYD